MKSEWKVTSNPINGHTMYGVYRLLDTSKVDHSGNREIGSVYMESRDDAEQLAARLNQEEEVAIESR